MCSSMVQQQRKDPHNTALLLEIRERFANTNSNNAYNNTIDWVKNNTIHYEETLGSSKLKQYKFCIFFPIWNNHSSVRIVRIVRMSSVFVLH